MTVATPASTRTGCQATPESTSTCQRVAALVQGRDGVQAAITQQFDLPHRPLAILTLGGARGDKRQRVARQRERARVLQAVDQRAAVVDRKRPVRRSKAQQMAAVFKRPDAVEIRRCRRRPRELNSRRRRLRWPRRGSVRDLNRPRTACDRRRDGHANNHHHNRQHRRRPTTMRWRDPSEDIVVPPAEPLPRRPSAGALYVARPPLEVAPILAGVTRRAIRPNGASALQLRSPSLLRRRDAGSDAAPPLPVARSRPTCRSRRAPGRSSAQPSAASSMPVA